MPECSADRIKASDGVEYVYVSLSSDAQSYKIDPKKDGKWKTVTSGGTADKSAKVDTDMSSYQGSPGSGPDNNLPYYSTVREKITAKLKNNYTKHYNDGDVHIFFVLDRDGKVGRIDVALSRSTKDTKLIDTALLSLQQAAPFGPFPKEIEERQVLFGLVISFKKDS